jgi:hypothetical protein
VKKISALVLVLGLAALAMALVSHHARGRGAIAVGEEARGAFGLEVHKMNQEVRGRMEFTERTRQGVRHVVKLPAVVGADFEDRSVVFAGPGMLDRNRVRVEVRALDGADPEHPDAFAIVCRNPEGRIVYSARGQLLEGEIVIRHDR